MRRRILLTAGSGVLSTTAPAGFGAAFATGGVGGLATAGLGDGSAAGTGSPVCEVVALLAARSSLSGLSTMRILRLPELSGYTLQRGKEYKLKNYTTPRSAGITLCVETSIRLYIKSAEAKTMQNLIIAARCDIYTLFRNLLASAFLLS